MQFVLRLSSKGELKWKYLNIKNECICARKCVLPDGSRWVSCSPFSTATASAVTSCTIRADTCSEHRHTHAHNGVNQLMGFLSRGGRGWKVLVIRVVWIPKWLEKKTNPKRLLCVKVFVLGAIQVSFNIITTWECQAGSFLLRIEAKKKVGRRTDCKRNLFFFILCTLFGLYQIDLNWLSWVLPMPTCALL